MASSFRNLVYAGATIAVLLFAARASIAQGTASKPAASTLSFIRLYTDSNGISHFRDEVLQLEKQGEGPLAAHGLGDVNGATFAMLKAGATEDWHVAPRRQIVLCLRGLVEITAADGEKRLVRPGQFMLLDDTSGKGHVTRVLGSEDHVALMIAIPADMLVRSR
jgi:hypothetical protein